MKILFAEDDLATRKLLEASLQSWGYDVVALDDGAKAWEALRREDGPKLALLDWVMPGMPGVEVCKKINERHDRRFIYTILITSKRDTEDVIQGLESGAHDYMVKPFDRQELKSRIEVGVRIVEYEEALEKKNEQLRKYAQEMESLAQERAEQLVHTDRLATLGTMSAGIAHEISNPVTALAGNMDVLGMIWPKLQAALLQTQLAQSGDIQMRSMIEETPLVIQGMETALKRIIRIVKSLSAYARKGDGEDTECDVNACIGEATDLCQPVVKGHVAVKTDLAEDLPPVRADGQEIEQVLVNLFTNASHAMENSGGGTLTVTTELCGDAVCVYVEDTGPGIPDEHIEDIFKPFFTTKGAMKGTGLGLAICRKIVADNQGTIKAENRPEKGARFTVRLPVAIPKGSVQHQDALAGNNVR